MSIKRVQKLLFSEYCDFEDMVLIESPFAQTTREGQGLRQVHLGLTPSKLVLATDVLPPVEKSCVSFLPGIDPTIETFELIAIYPIDCVNLSVFRKHKRQTIKAHFCNNRVFFFELGGFENRTMFWNLWCEKVKFLSPESGSSHSETSVATSSTCSTLYVVDRKQVTKPNGLTQIWCKFGTGKNGSSKLVPKWTDRNIYLGKNSDNTLNYKPIMYSPRLSQFIKPKTKTKKLSNFSVSKRGDSNEKSDCKIGDWYPINRFGSGVKEGCNSSLHLPCDDYILPRRWSQTTDQSSASFSKAAANYQKNDVLGVAENCVRVWEQCQVRQRHRRRYGFAPQPLFLYGLGPWNINAGSKYSIQVKRAVSVVAIRRQPAESELRLPITKRQLVATISCETLDHDKTKKSNQLGCGGPRRPVILFWTPDYWYRPRSARDAYQELHNHLAKITNFHRKSKKKHRLFKRRAPKLLSSSSSLESTISPRKKTQKPKKCKSIMRIFGGKTQICDTAFCCLLWSSLDRQKFNKETPLQYLKRMLHIDVVLTAWDFNSTTLAQQLTMIDRDLFLKISGIELGILMSQQSSKNAPNVAATVAFSHRISCLVASDILKNDNLRLRARLIARFVTIAEKCHRISNFQSCRTVLLGLQSPAIFRLRNTWAYVRKKHASKYQSFEFLCKVYRDPRLFRYQRTFYVSSRSTPYLPFIGDIIAKLLDRIPEYKIEAKPRPGKEPSVKEETINDTLFTRLLAFVNLSNRQQKSSKGLCDYFKPLDCYEDNRLKCLVETTEFLQQCQLSALHYSFMSNCLAVDYLLKARYKEEKENFYQSLRIESVGYMED